MRACWRQAHPAGTLQGGGEATRSSQARGRDPRPRDAARTRLGLLDLGQAPSPGDRHLDQHEHEAARKQRRQRSPLRLHGGSALRKRRRAGRTCRRSAARRQAPCGTGGSGPASARRPACLRGADPAEGAGALVRSEPQRSRALPRTDRGGRRHALDRRGRCGSRPRLDRRSPWRTARSRRRRQTAAGRCADSAGRIRTALDRAGRGEGVERPLPDPAAHRPCPLRARGLPGPRLAPRGGSRLGDQLDADRGARPRHPLGRGEALVGSLASSESVEPAVGAVWDIATSLLRNGGIAMFAYGLVIFLGAVLAGPLGFAKRARRSLAPLLRERASAYAAAAIVVLLLLWWGPTEGFRRPLPLLVLLALFVAGIEALRRQTLREYPRETWDDLRDRWAMRLSRRPSPATATRRRRAEPRVDPASTSSSDLSPCAMRAPSMPRSSRGQRRSYWPDGSACCSRSAAAVRSPLILTAAEISGAASTSPTVPKRQPPAIVTIRTASGWSFRAAP